MVEDPLRHEDLDSDITNEQVTSQMEVSGDITVQDDQNDITQKSPPMPRAPKSLTLDHMAVYRHTIAQLDQSF